MDILKAWGLEGAKVTLWAERENRIFQVMAKGMTYALRQHRQGLRTRQQIEAELTWMTNLSAQGFAVPRPLVPLVWQQDQGPYFSLVTWLKGRPLGADKPEIFNVLGHLIARLHALPDVQLERPHWTADALLGSEPLWGQFWEHEALNRRERELLLRFRNAARAQLEALNMPVRLIHADMLKENVLVNGAEVALIDFDDCAYSYPLFDLTAPLVQRLPDPHFADTREALLAGYGPVDRQALALLFAVRCCTYLGWVRDKRSTAEGKAMSERIRVRAIKQARLWLDGRSPIL